MRIDLTETEVKYLLFVLSTDMEILSNGDWESDDQDRHTAMKIMEKLQELSEV